jgi:hypothetical protein
MKFCNAFNKADRMRLQIVYSSLESWMSIYLVPSMVDGR